MSLRFLPDAVVSSHAQLPSNLTPDQLRDHFTLTARDLSLILERRRAHNKLGFAVQLCTLRFLGTFARDLLETPPQVLSFVAGQLGMPTPRDLKPYVKRDMTVNKHQHLIREALGYSLFDDFQAFSLTRWIYRTLLMGDERPLALFEQAQLRLSSRKVVLPGPSTLGRIIVQVRQRVSRRSYQVLAKRLSPTHKETLENLLLVPEGERLSHLDTLRKAPVRASTPSLLLALERLGKLRTLGLQEVNTTDQPPGRIKAFERQGMTAWIQTLTRWGETRRHATLLVTVQHLERRALSVVLDVFERLMTQLSLTGGQRYRTERLRSLKDLDDAARVLSQAVKMLLEWKKKRPLARDQILSHFGEETLQAAAQQVQDLTSSEVSRETQAWLGAQNTVWAFFARFLEGVEFEGTSSVKALLEAITFLKSDSWKKLDWDKAPRTFVPKSWKAAVYSTSTGLNTKVYVLCVAQQLYLQLKGRHIYVPSSLRHRDPRAGLLSAEVWDKQRLEIARSLERSLDPKIALGQLERDLDTAYKNTLEALPANAALRFETLTHKERREEVTKVLPHLTPLDTFPESPTLKPLLLEVSRRMPTIDLSELVLEVNAYTRFAREFIVLKEGKDSVTEDPDLELSICAVLVAQACNIPLRSVMRPDVPALTLTRLSYVQHTYLRNDTLTRANAKLVEAHSSLPLVQHWGRGEVASADGLRFVVPVKSLYSAPNPKYFGQRRGVTYFSFTSDQYTGFGGQVIPGTVRDSLYILAGLLEQDTSLMPKEIMTDTASYTDIIFGLFHLLGYRFAPRIADLKNTRLWRMDSSTNYGDLNKLARNKVNTALIADQWDELLRLAGSLKLRTVQAPDILRTLTRGQTPTALGQAAAELGRIAKTLHLLEYLQDEDYRRRILIQQSSGEQRHHLARVVHYGRRGELRAPYHEGMEDHLGALGLIVNAITVWNTKYLQAVPDWLEVIGEAPNPEDLAHLSPLRYEHIHMLGRYPFSLHEDVKWGGLRPLRDPDNLETWSDLEWAA